MPEEIGLFAESGNDTDHAYDASAAEPAEAPQLVFGSAEEFLHEQLLPTYIRDVDDRRAKWCTEWYFHPEAVSRVEAIWRAWEHLRLEGATGISVWWRDHADHHMRVLFDPQGPFYNCDKSGHRDSAHLKPTLAPKGWFPDVRLQGLAVEIRVLELFIKHSGPTGLRAAGRSNVLRWARNHSRKDPVNLIHRAAHRRRQEHTGNPPLPQALSPDRSSASSRHSWLDSPP